MSGADEGTASGATTTAAAALSSKLDGGWHRKLVVQLERRTRIPLVRTKVAAERWKDQMPNDSIAAIALLLPTLPAPLSADGVEETLRPTIRDYCSVLGRVPARESDRPARQPRAGGGRQAGRQRGER